MAYNLLEHLLCPLLEEAFSLWESGPLDPYIEPEVAGEGDMHHPHESPGVSRNGYTPISAFDSQTHEDSTSTELVQDMSKIHALFPRCRQMAG